MMQSEIIIDFENLWRSSLSQNVDIAKMHIFYDLINQKLIQKARMEKVVATQQMRRKDVSIALRRKTEINWIERFLGTLLKYHAENKTAVTASEGNTEVNTLETSMNTPVYTSQSQQWSGDCASLGKCKTMK